MRRAVVSGLVLVWLGSGAASAGIVFDQPLAVETHNLPAAPGQMAQTYVCRRFKTFTLKSVRWEDRTWTSDHFVLPGKDAPCRPEAPWTPETVVADNPGVLGGFIVHEDAAQERHYISVYDTATGQDVFTATSTAPPESMRLTADGFVVRLRRIYDAPCSLYYGIATACWADVRAATGLTDAMLPDCAAKYETIQKKWQIPAAKMRTHRSQLVYPVEVRFAGGKLAYTALPGPAVCNSNY